MVYNKIIWIHRMAAILSELTSKVNISALKDRLTEVYANVNDKIIKVKEALTEDKKPEDKKPEDGKKEEKKESYAAPPPAPKTTKDKIFEFLNKLKEYFITAGIFLLRVMFYVFLASLVANDMIMYSPVIRAFFFGFTLFVTLTFPLYAVFLTSYYALRKGYDYYHQKLSSEKVKPPISFPMIFAILPLTTMYPESSIVRFFMWAFMYQKSDKPERMEKENDRLEIIMTEYWKDLNTSFDYLNSIKTNEPFSRLYELNKEHLTRDYMHPIKKPDTIVEPSKTLPDVIEEEKEENKGLVPPQSKEQANKDAVNKEAEIKEVAIKAVSNKAAANKAAANKSSPPPPYNANASTLPPVIQPTNSTAPPPAYNANTSTLPPVIQPTNSTTPPPAYNANTSTLPPVIQPTNSTTPPPAYNANTSTLPPVIKSANSPTSKPAPPSYNTIRSA